jgi:lysophospholipase L1-like esterase
MLRLIKIVGVLLCLQLSACSDSQPQLSALSADSIVLAFGDSLTEGVGAGNRKTESYPAVLSQLSGIPIVNSGISGEVSKDGLVRLKEEIEEYEPDLIILCHGGNDLIRKLGEPQLKQNLKQMITAAKASGAEVMLIAVPSFNLTAKVPDLYMELAAEFQLPIQKDIVRSIETSPSLKADPIHPNTLGYRQFAEAVHQLLMETHAISH